MAAFVLFVLLMIAIAVALFLGLRWFDLKTQNNQIGTELEARSAEAAKHEARVAKLTEYAGELKVKIHRLAKWSQMANAEYQAEALLANAVEERAKAEHEAMRLIENAQRQSHDMVAAGQVALENAKAEGSRLCEDAGQQASGLVPVAEGEAKRIVMEARQQAKSLQTEATAALHAATSTAAQLIADANKKAEGIAGSAFTAMKNAALYEQTVRAMKNIINGYGDQYLIPPRNLLDELAEDYDHAKAGQELKRSREQTLLMVRNGTAGRCEYVETHRKDTAIAFVVDAFNGKVDSILSRVRNDNAGTLQQEMRDAFTLVNFNGKAFRDACINDEFLASRLDELKWGAVVQQMKLDEREEQRQIKEQIREEEKARKEHERAIREAVRDEEIVRKAIEKTQLEMRSANAEQRARYEGKLAELALRLTEAEQRNQRALSMAQQTKRGHVYIISNVGSFGDNVYKIGLTRRLDPLDRVRELGDSSVPFEFDVHAMILSNDAPALEHQLHKHFVLSQMNKVNTRKEFFKVDLAHVRGEIESLGLSAKWTMTAEARQYRETLAIEKIIRDDPKQRQAWIKRQLALDLIDDETMEEIELGVK
jgi:diphthamide synthase (EF-2-diphthine--ammonia ligase)